IRRSGRTARPPTSSRPGPAGSRTSSPRRSPPPSCAKRPRSTPSGTCSRRRALPRSRRFVSREGRELRRELLVSTQPELGIVALAGPSAPEASLVAEAGRVVEIDGRREPDWDVIDHFLARHGLDLDAAEEAMAIPEEELARRLVDVDVPRAELVRLSRGL